jgi:hypothetical protein
MVNKAAVRAVGMNAAATAPSEEGDYVVMVSCTLQVFIQLNIYLQLSHR